MGVTYGKLWELLEEKEMKKIELQRKAGISGNILARMGRNEYISMESVEKMCRILHCGVDDMLDFIDEDSAKSEDKQMGNKLELTWYGKEDSLKIEPRLLIENVKLLYGCDNDGITECIFGGAG